MKEPVLDLDFSPEHWLEQAEKMRAQAREMKYPVLKAELEAIARGYERLASHAAKRQASDRSVT